MIRYEVEPESTLEIPLGSCSWVSDARLHITTRRGAGNVDLTNVLIFQDQAGNAGCLSNVSTDLGSIAVAYDAIVDQGNLVLQVMNNETIDPISVDVHIVTLGNIKGF